MVVLLPSGVLGLRRRVDDDTLNAHGERQAVSYAPITELLPGRAREQADGTWAVALDPLLWPVRVNDVVQDDTGRAWVITGSQLLENAYDPTVDWVRCTALETTAEGTEPGQPWFVGRND